MGGVVVAVDDTPADDLDLAADLGVGRGELEPRAQVAGQLAVAAQVGGEELGDRLDLRVVDRRLAHVDVEGAALGIGWSGHGGGESNRVGCPVTQVDGDPPEPLLGGPSDGHGHRPVVGVGLGDVDGPDRCGQVDGLGRRRQLGRVAEKRGQHVAFAPGLEVSGHVALGEPAGDHGRLARHRVGIGLGRGRLVGRRVGAQQRRQATEGRQQDQQPQESGATPRDGDVRNGKSP